MFQQVTTNAGDPLRKLQQSLRKPLQLSTAPADQI